MPKAIRIHEYGGPEVLKWEEVDVGSPGEGQIQVRNVAAGLNYIDTYHRSGAYRIGDLPAVIGMEGAGVVEEVGAGVSDLEPGDRVGYVDPIGSYAELRNMPAGRAVRLPEGVDEMTAAASMLQGMTVRYLFLQTFPVRPGTVMLFHAAAGGVGLIACQWARHIGARLIGTVGTDEKGELAKAHGASHVINYREHDFVEKVREITDGRGCDVVYDAIGKDTFPGSLDCLRPRGMWVQFGAASGPPPPFEVKDLGSRGSLFATRPSLFHHVGTTQELRQTAGDLFELMARGIIQIRINQTYRLREAEAAHRDLEGRKTTGSTVLSVD